MRLTIQWKFLGTSLLLVTISLGTMGFLVLGRLREDTLQQIQDSLDAQARLAAAIFLPHLEKNETAFAIDPPVDGLGNQIHARVTVIRSDGMVLGDSSKSGPDLAGMENHLDRPEIQQALKEGIGTSIRHSDTVNIRMLYLALPLKAHGRHWGFVRLAVPLTDLDRRIAHLRSVVSWTLLAAFGLALTLSYPFSRRLTQPLREMMSVAGELAKGRLNRRIALRSQDEVTDLGRVLNQMAADLETRMTEITEDRARLTAILSSMVEGVLVLDCRGTILMVNTALERMFRLKEQEVIGRSYLEALRHYPLIALIKTVLDSRTNQSQEVVIQIPQETHFYVQASVAPDCRDQEVCAVLVFHDITELKRLERVRKDFVANVSHELKTPLTSIKGYIEALVDGAKDDPKKCSAFLSVIQKHTDDLNATLSDLLQLSTIESGQYRWKREAVSVLDLIEKAVGLVRSTVEKKKQSLSIISSESLPDIYGDSDKLTEVLINLLDNAVKYTPEDGKIMIEARAIEEAVEISVSDTGVGIPPKEIPRIFERFYRVDRARSRELGGTGLGLSIVKHIVEAHRGTVHVQSEPGKGSRFTVVFPLHPI